jgi:ATP-binding cassette subfamily B protein
MLLGMETTQVLVGQIITFTFSFWTGILVLCFACLVSVWLALLVLVVMAANLLLNWWLTEQRYDSNRKLAIEQGKAMGKGLQGINNIETLKASGLEFDFLSQWQGSFGNVVVQNQLLGAQMAFSSVAASGSTFLLNTLIIALGGYLIIQGQISLGTLIAFQFLQSQLTAPISLLPQLSSVMQRLIGDLGRLEDLKKNEDDPLVRSFEIISNSDHDPSQSELKGSLEIRNLTFSFSKVTEPFIKELNLNIPAGSQLSIVGGSGSGKTTLIRIIAGLYQPSSGDLLFDGKPWNSHGNSVMRNGIAYVPQQVFVFNASVHDNVTLWKPGYTLEELENAASDAQILKTINNHPESFSRMLRDNGSDLSGGERQRLEICRALLRNPKILLFDEATSALDNATQSKVLDSLKRRNITVINVAHRLDAALRSDQVLVMDHGTVVERGSPNELIAKKGLFYDLVQNDRSQSVSPEDNS